MSEQEATGAAGEEPVGTSIKLFVGNLAYKTTTESLQAEFSSVGTLVSCDVIMRLTNKRTPSLGYGFVAYATQAEADAAVAKYNLKEFEGRELIVEVARVRKPKEKRAKKEPSEPKEAAASAPPQARKSRERKRRPKRAPVERAESQTLVFVANLPFDVDDAQLAALFADYKTTSCNLVKRHNGNSMGYGFVDLESHEEQQRAIAGLTGVESKGRELVVKVALDKLAAKPQESGEAAAPAAEEPVEAKE